MTELDIALTMDDVLYEKFKELNRQFMERVYRFNARERIRQVRKRVGNIDVHLKILEVHDTGEGLVIIVE